MKLSFNIGENEYIGDYYVEYRKAGLLKAKSVKTVLKRREGLKDGSIIKIVKESTRLDSYVMTECEESKDIDFKIVCKNIMRYREMEKPDYKKIEMLINERYAELLPYINDFALIVISAKNKCFGNWTQDSKLERVLNEEKKREIRNFYTEMLEKGIDVKSITVKYNNTQKLIFEEAILIKMMLYEFAKKYFTLFEKFDDEHWEEELNNLIIEKAKKGAPGHTYSKDLRAIIHVFWNFIDNEKILEGKTRKEKYQLLGELLVMAEYPKFDELKDERYYYSDSGDYYYKTLIKYWKPPTRTK